MLTGHLRAKRPGESVRNAGAFIVAQGMFTPGVLAKIKKRGDSASVWDPEPFTGRFRVIDLFFVLLG